MRMAARLEMMGAGKYQGLTRKSGVRAVWTGKIAIDRKALEAPKSWKNLAKFSSTQCPTCSTPTSRRNFVRDVWLTMGDTPQYTYQIVTKRPDRMAELTGALPLLRYVWLGASVETADYLDRIDDLRRVRAVVRFISFEPPLGSVAGADLSDIHWAIVGGESGPRARPMDPHWVEEIEAACRRFGTAFFFKQWGGKNKKAAGRVLNGRTYDEMPAALA